MNSPRDAYAFSSSPVPARGEASGTTASPLGSGVSFQYAQAQGYGNEDNCSELGSEPGNGRVSQETEDHYDPQSDDEPGDDSEERGAGSRTTHGPLNCPYRKRNKQRFNIRDHAKCTKPFKEFSHLKSHIKTCHKREGGPVNHEDPAHDVEDGITEDIDNLLIARKNRHKVASWEGLWKTLFPDDKEVPSPVYEPCIKASVDEFLAMAKKAMDEDINAQVVLVFNILRQSLHDSWQDADTLLQISYKIVADMNSQSQKSFVEWARKLEPAVSQRTPILSGSLRLRSTKPHRRGNGGSRDIARKGGSAGAPSLPNEQLAPRQRRLHPVPNGVGENGSSFIGYSLQAATHQQQGAMNTANPFQSSTDSGYHPGWTRQPNETEFAAPATTQFDPNLAISHWMDPFASHQFPGSIQANQPSVPGILESYQPTPAAYGPHLDGGSLYSGFSTR